MNAILACLRCGGSFEGKFWLINSREYKCLQLTAHKNLLKFLYLYFLWSTIRKKIIETSCPSFRIISMYNPSNIFWDELILFKMWKRGRIRLEGPLQVDKNVKKKENPRYSRDIQAKARGFINCYIIDPVRRVNQSLIK